MDYQAQRLLAVALERQQGVCAGCHRYIRQPERALLVQRASTEPPGPLRPVAQSIAVHNACR